MLTLTTLLACAVTGIVTAVVMFALSRGAVASQPATGPEGPQSLGAAQPDDVVFLFRDRALVDATDSARAQLPASPAETDDLGRFVIAFSHRFEGVARRMATALAEHGQVGADDVAGNLCRCTGYTGIVRAALETLEHNRKERDETHV